MQNSKVKEFTKILSRSEARHRYWQLHKAERDMFPEQFQIFKLKYSGKIFEMKVNNRDCIMTGQLYADGSFAEGGEITITKNKDGIFELIAS